ncbi:MAG: response regulator [Methanobacterium sp.]|nr:response regulator [Methanobacterium sp.]
MTDPIKILLVEDNPADIRLIKEVFKDTDSNNEIYVVKDGVDALNFLNKKAGFGDAPKPDIILLDLNLPRKDGREVLKEIKENDNFKYIPIVVLTTSSSKEDVIKTYGNHANCYITKPVDFDRFLKVIRSIEDFWLKMIELPRMS